MRIALFKCTLKKHCWILILIASSICGVLTVDTTGAYGQEVRNAIRDYRDDRVFNYQASDPQYRGKLFNVHTGHYGRFYNCDSQENKRNSPYICWKPHYENDFPARLGFCENLRRDITEIKQRISDGAGNCGSSCDCKQCQFRQRRQTYQPQQHKYPSDSPCVQCATSSNGSANAPSVSTEISNSNPANQKSRIAGSVSPHSHMQKKSYGLVSGKIFDPVSAAQRSSLGQRSFGQSSDQERLETGSKVTSPLAQPSRPIGPRVVERTEFRKQFKVF